MVWLIYLSIELRQGPVRPRKMTTAGCVGVDFAASGKENIVDGSSPIENCSWDDIAVTTTLTNAASRTKKGESLKVTNATRLQGFRINVIPSVIAIVEDWRAN